MALVAGGSREAKTVESWRRQGFGGLVRSVSDGEQIRIEVAIRSVRACWRGNARQSRKRRAAAVQYLVLLVFWPSVISYPAAADVVDSSIDPACKHVLGFPQRSKTSARSCQSVLPLACPAQPISGPPSDSCWSPLAFLGVLSRSDRRHRRAGAPNADPPSTDP